MMPLHQGHGRPRLSALCGFIHRTHSRARAHAPIWFWSGWCTKLTCPWAGDAWVTVTGSVTLEIKPFLECVLDTLTLWKAGRGGPGSTLNKAWLHHCLEVSAWVLRKGCPREMLKSSRSTREHHWLLVFQACSLLSQPYRAVFLAMQCTQKAPCYSLLFTPPAFMPLDPCTSLFHLGSALSLPHLPQGPAHRFPVYGSGWCPWVVHHPLCG